MIEKLLPYSSFLTLHVSAGTFKPIEAVTVDDHKMHSETFACSKMEVLRVIEALKANKDILAVGTTSARTLETLYWIGTAIIREGNDRTHLGQFDCYR